jgi:hypothetical protein
VQSIATEKERITDYKTVNVFLSSMSRTSIIKGIPNAKNMPIVRIGICNTNNDIPKHNVAKPRIKIQRFVRLSTIYRIQAPLEHISTICHMGFLHRTCVNVPYIHRFLDGYQLYSLPVVIFLMY